MAVFSCLKRYSVSIDERPATVDTRERLGDWDADTVLGKQGTGLLLSTPA